VFLASLTLNFLKLTGEKFRGKVCQLGFSLKFYEKYFRQQVICDASPRIAEEG
jgi:hypothetical protein